MNTVTAPKPSAAERQEAITRLRDMLPPGTTVYCVLRHSAASGMSRDIQFLAARGLAIVDISHLVARVLGLRRHSGTGAVKVHGTGMDMGFAVVYDLGRVLYPEADTPGGPLNREWL